MNTRQWPPWGLIFSRQYVYDLGGGPVWPVRTEQFKTLPREYRPWAVRFDATPETRSDWLFEREWRIPRSTLPLTTTNLVCVLIGDRNWQPVREIETGWFRSGETGEMAHPGELHAQPDTRPSLPALWAIRRVYWSHDAKQFDSAADQT